MAAAKPLAEILSKSYNPMKSIYFLFLLLIFSCENRNEQEVRVKNEAIENQGKAKTSGGIQEIETISFRRTYVGHENLSDKALDKLYKSNPSLLTYDRNSDVVKKLNDKKVLKNTELILSNFEDKRLTKEYLDLDKKIEITCDYDSKYSSKLNLKVNKENKKELKTLDFKGDHIVGVILKDIDDDGIKEILILTNSYIMNGDNFVITLLKYV